MPTVPADAFPYTGQTYPADSVLIDSQRSINLYPETALSSSKTRVALIGTPGITQFSIIGAPVRALWAGNSRLFAVGGFNFYEISSVGAIIQDYGIMPGSLGTGPCQIVQGVGPAFKLLVMDSSSSRIYEAQTTPSFAMIPRADAIALEYLDGFFVAIAKPVSGTTQNQIMISNTGVTWPSPALALTNRTGSNDLVTMIAVMQGQLWIFGEKTIEVWYNAGNSPFPFARVSGATLNYGLLAKFSVCKVENRLMWLGADESGWPVIFQTTGLLPTRVSNFAIENLIHRSYGPQVDRARAFTYREAGHLFYVLNFPNGTVAYDVNTGMWHERGYLNPLTGLMERARADCMASVGIFPQTTYNFVGDYANGKIYIQNIDLTSDNGDPIKRIRTSPHVSNSDKWMAYPRLEISADIGTAGIVLEISNNGGRSFGNAFSAEFASTDLSVDGFGRFSWTQLGRSRDRVFRTSITDSANRIRLIAGYLDVIPGTE